ncbi:MAG TPA: hypothetical protein VGI88_05730 [Verrucomicrobiae bacterium]
MDELIRGLRQCLLCLCVIRFFGRNSAREQFIKNLQAADLGYYRSVLEVAGGFQGNLSRGFFGQQFGQF